MRAALLFMVLSSVPLGLAACSDIAAREVCEPASTRPCACAGGDSGTQTCLADQTFSDCRCDGVDADAAVDGGLDGGDTGDSGADGAHRDLVNDDADTSPNDSGADGHEEPSDAEIDTGGVDDPEPEVATDTDPDSGSDPDGSADLDGDTPEPALISLLGICDEERDCEEGLFCTAFGDRTTGAVHSMCTASCDVPCPSVNDVEMSCIAEDNRCVFPCNAVGLQSGCPVGMVCTDIDGTAGCVHAVGDCIDEQVDDVLGFRIGDFTLTNCEGTEVSFHSRCGQTGFQLIYPDSVFCDACADSVGTVLGIIEVAEQFGGELWWVLGEGAEGRITVEECRTRSVELGLEAEDMYIDPDFETLEAHFDGAGGDAFSLPHAMLVHTFDMSYQYSDSASSEALVDALTRMGAGRIRLPYFDCGVDIHRRDCFEDNICTSLATAPSRPQCFPPCDMPGGSCPDLLPGSGFPAVCSLVAGGAEPEYCAYQCVGGPDDCPDAMICDASATICYWSP